MAVSARKSARRQQLETAINYPIDWLEERSGLVGGIKYFLFRKVPGDTNWFHTLGSATLTAFLVQAVTGVILAMSTSRTRTARTSRSSTSRTTSPSAGSSAECTSGAPASSSS
jgi:quinol-cytochrome oxidoreductase complex cytochrome b subunit